MGMDISSRLMYGRYYKELVEHMTDEQVEKLDEDLDGGAIECASPWYDSSHKNWFIGADLVEDFDLEGVRAFLDSLAEAEKWFEEAFGMKGTVLSVPDVT